MCSLIVGACTHGLSGSGKTLVAILALRAYASQLSQPDRIAVFLAPSVPLCLQVGVGLQCHAHVLQLRVYSCMLGAVLACYGATAHVACVSVYTMVADE